MNKQEIKQLALDNGFKLKEQSDGTMDLNPYVYDFAYAIQLISAKNAIKAFQSQFIVARKKLDEEI